MSEAVLAASPITDATNQPNPNEAPPVTPTPPPEAADARPEWLPEKFKTAQDLATSYTALEAKLRENNEETRSSLLDEIKSEKAEGVPVDATGYTIPEGFGDEAAKESELYGQFSEWAYERQLPQDDFDELVSFYASTFLPDLAAEKEKLGANAEQRITALSQWVGTNVPDDVKATVMSMATTAANVAALESIMKLTVPQNLPNSDAVLAPAGEILDDSKVRILMASPAYLDPSSRDPAVVKQVDEYYAAKYKQA
jgi:hypothetical protein